jgi:hypothetical protein
LISICATYSTGNETLKNSFWYASAIVLISRAALARVSLLFLFFL